MPWPWEKHISIGIDSQIGCNLPKIKNQVLWLDWKVRFGLCLVEPIGKSWSITNVRIEIQIGIFYVFMHFFLYLNFNLDWRHDMALHSWTINRPIQRKWLAESEYGWIIKISVISENQCAIPPPTLIVNMSQSVGCSYSFGNNFVLILGWKK